MHTTVQPQIDKLSHDIYDYLLREAGDYPNPDEWYEVALTVVERLRAEIIDSRRRHAPLFRVLCKLSLPRYKTRRVRIH